MTNGQIEKLLCHIRSALRKSGPEFSKEGVQLALMRGILNTRVAAAVKAAVHQALNESINIIDCILCELDRSRTLLDILNGFEKRFEKRLGDYHFGTLVENSILTTIPPGSGVEQGIIVEFFQLNLNEYPHSLSADELKKILSREYKLRGLKIDPCAVAAANEDKPFGLVYPNCAVWEAGGEWHHITFKSFNYRLAVCVSEGVGGLQENNMWFGGVRKRGKITE